jgi:hypothetical protein
MSQKRTASRRRAIATATALLIFGAFALSAFDTFAAPARQRLGRIGDIAFGTSFDDAKSASDVLAGLPYTTGDRRVLRTLTQHKASAFDTTFNFTYVFGEGDRLTLVFGSHPSMLNLDRKTCAAVGADLFAASVRQFGSPDHDRNERDGREWRFDFADGRWLKLRYMFGGVLDRCSITLDSVTPEGKNDRP